MTGITRTAGHQYSYAGKGPFPGVTSITALQDAVGGSDGLLNWAVGLALDKVEALAGAKNVSWEETRSAAFQAKNELRDLGSAVHAAVDLFNRHLTFEVSKSTAPYLAQYGAFAYQHGLEVIGSERFVINTSIGFGGTYDLLGKIDGELSLLDVKTGKERLSQRLQLAGLSMGELHGEPGEEPEPMPSLDGVGFILLLRPDGYELVRHEITQADLDHFTYLVNMYHRVRDWSASFTPGLVKETAA